MTNDSKKQTIELTKKQFLSLLKAAYLGNWMANAHRTEDLQEEYEEAENLLFSLTPQFGLNDYIDRERFEEKTDVETIQSEYDEEVFWNELTARLGAQCFTKRYSEAEVDKMNEKERFAKLHDCINFCADEFEKFGLERINI